MYSHFEPRINTIRNWMSIKLVLYHRHRVFSPKTSFAQPSRLLLSRENIRIFIEWPKISKYNIIFIIKVKTKAGWTIVSNNIYIYICVCIYLHLVEDILWFISIYSWQEILLILSSVLLRLFGGQIEILEDSFLLNQVRKDRKLIKIFQIWSCFQGMINRLDGLLLKEC